MGLGTIVSRISSLGRPDGAEGSAEETRSIPIGVGTAPATVDQPSGHGQTPITAETTMEEINSRYPSAQRALFQKYHVGGCHSCGYDEKDTLRQVLASHGFTDMKEAIDFILESDEVERKIQVSASEAARLIKEDPSVKLLDVRDEHERSIASIPGSVLLSREVAQEMVSSWPKDGLILFHCHHGIRSMDAASYFAGHGFTNVRSISGGIDAWSAEIDPSIPRY